MSRNDEQERRTDNSHYPISILDYRIGHLEPLSTHPRKRHFDTETFWVNPSEDSGIIAT